MGSCGVGNTCGNGGVRLAVKRKIQLHAGFNAVGCTGVVLDDEILGHAQLGCDVIDALISASFICVELMTANDGDGKIHLRL